MMITSTTKGITMTTLTDDLHLVLSWCQTTYPGIPSEVVDNTVYLNYDYATAVVVGVDFEETGKVWHATAIAWDRTGGIAADKELAQGDLPGVLRAVSAHLEQERDDADKLERLLSERPED
jgi:hypothetical protein